MPKLSAPTPEPPTESPASLSAAARRPFRWTAYHVALLASTGVALTPLVHFGGITCFHPRLEIFSLIDRAGAFLLDTDVPQLRSVGDRYMIFRNLALGRWMPVGPMPLEASPHGAMPGHFVGLGRAKTICAANGEPNRAVDLGQKHRLYHVNVMTMDRG